jgi:hypothetical protein
MAPRIRALALLTAATVLCAGPAPARSQDHEPNDACDALSPPMPVSVPGTLQGNLAARGAKSGSDVDFFVLSVEPGTAVFATSELEGRVAVFDRACTRIARSSRPPHRLWFRVPADGVVTLAVASGDDGTFAGSGSANSGPYEITLRPPLSSPPHPPVVVPTEPGSAPPSASVCAGPGGCQPACTGSDCPRAPR